ncbi:MAG: hypothetical protein R2819_10170 [Allomuricauda sp.]
MKSKINAHILINICLVVLLLGCGNVRKKEEIVLTETEGIPRQLEYVTIKSANHHAESLFLKDVATGDVIRGEKLAQENPDQDTTSYIFPISISANAKRTFSVLDSDPDQNEKPEEHPLQVSGENMAITVENEYFVADFNTNSSKAKKGLYPGQLAGIFIKKKNVLLKREQNNMHWAPNFQKEQSGDYKTIGHANLDHAKITQNNPYKLEMVKEGRVEGYEEIDLWGKYEFFAGLPYFMYSSTMSFNEDANLFLLRNNEMTMDKLFTHLVFPDSTGKNKEIILYGDEKELDSLANAPLAHDIHWVGFINKPLGYGLISLQLYSDNTHKNGGESTLFGHNMKMTKSMNEGRYWDRRLIDNHNTLVSKGSTYREKNAYLVLDDLDDIDGKIANYFKCLSHPIVIQYPSE